MPSVEISPIQFGTIVPICESLIHPFRASLYRADVSPQFDLHSDVSRTSNLSLSAYLRTSQGMVGQDNMGNDLLMGRLDLTPVLDAHVCHFLISSVQVA
jgi:hypothetical protein